MILGIGTDICDIDRIASITKKQHAERFVARILTTAELEKYFQLSDKRKIEFVAGRFALKEAVSKALGTGIGSIVGFLDITILNDINGKPCCHLSDASYHKLNLHQESIAIHCSISHEKHYAIAYVVVEQR